MNVLSLAAGGPEASFEGWQHVRVRALLVGKRIDLRALQRGSELAGQPVAVPAGEKGLAVLFRYGAVVTFHMQPVEQAAFLKSLQSVVGEPFETTETEEADVVVDDSAQTEGVDGSGNIRLQPATMDRLFVIADVLAKSVILAYDENRVAAVFDRIEPVAERLHRAGRTVSVRDLLGHIADVLITQHRMVGRVEVAEKPELVWDRSDMERLYVRLREEYELTERDRALSRKLELISADSDHLARPGPGAAEPPGRVVHRHPDRGGDLPHPLQHVHRRQLALGARGAAYRADRYPTANGPDDHDPSA